MAGLAKPDKSFRAFPRVIQRNIMKVLSRALCALALILGGLHVAHAGIQINGTRVIYRADQREG